MRTNVEIDDTLLAEAKAATGLKTKRKVVEAGLKLLARRSGSPGPERCLAASDGKATCIGNARMGRSETDRRK